MTEKKEQRSAGTKTQPNVLGRPNVTIHFFFFFFCLLFSFSHSTIEKRKTKYLDMYISFATNKY